MKTKIATLILSVAATWGFAQDQAAPVLQSASVTTPRLSSLKDQKASQSFTYIKMSATDSKVPDKHLEALPGLGLGFRICESAAALDISASFHSRNAKTDDGTEKEYTYTLPKAGYLRYLSPKKKSSLYAGVGLAWGGLKTKNNDEFHGLIPSAAIGYEMNRKASWKSFLQVDVSTPVIAAYKRGSLPKAYAEITLGSGF